VDKELEQKLLREISKSGFPLELRVVEQLRNVAPLVFPNLSFTAENDKLHEIDALAFLDREELEDRLEDKWPYGLVSTYSSSVRRRKASLGCSSRTLLTQ
jgi:hypothetical protein